MDSKATPLESLPQQNTQVDNVQMMVEQEQQQPQQQLQPPEAQPMYQPEPERQMPYQAYPQPERYPQHRPSQKQVYQPSKVSYVNKLKNIILNDWKKFIMLTLIIFFAQTETVNGLLRMIVRMAKVPDNMVFISSKAIASLISSLIYFLL